MKQSTYRHVHFVGIKGVAMTALALYLHEQNIVVTGSDVEGLFPTDEVLKQHNIPITIGFSPDTIHKHKAIDLCIYTGAHGGKDNVEVIEAEKLHIPVLPHGKALGMFMDTYTQISVAGSHGKTTTSAMVATILSHAGMRPSYCIGCGYVSGLGDPGKHDKGNVFIAEADEYVTDPGHDKTPRFLWQHPDILVVTNIDYDHPDAYKNIKEVQLAFTTLRRQQKGKQITIINNDDGPSGVLKEEPGVLVTYGYTDASDYQITNVRFNEGRTFFTMSLRGTQIGEFMLQVPGKHNVTNAAAAIACCFEYGVSFEQIRKGILQFKGAKRRLEIVAKEESAIIIDDYAHHPHEIQASIDALRTWYPTRRIISIFQPHTYSRTKELLFDFAASFAKSDVVCIADIYSSARETDTLGMTSARLVEEIAKHHSNVQYIRNYDGAVTFLKRHKEDGDIIVFMGAGDIYEWSKRCIKDLL